MKVFCHHIYEYSKGLRSLILHTVSSEFLGKIRYKLDKSGIDYQIYMLKNGNMNVFFGKKECVDVIRTIGKAQLRDYTPEEDFILGTMLGYDRLIQCRRYLEMLERKKANGAVFEKKNHITQSKNNSLYGDTYMEIQALSGAGINEKTP